jgi:HK97 gp10 family phage protein
VIHCRVDGGEQIAKALDKLSAAVNAKIVKEALVDGATPIVAEEQRCAPKRTGKYAKSIGIVHPKEARATGITLRGGEVWIGPRSSMDHGFLGLFLEYGKHPGGGMTPRPHIRPAWESQKQTALGTIISTFRWCVERALRGAL